MSPEESRQRLSSTNPRSAPARAWRETACELQRDAGRPFRRGVEARDRHPRWRGVLHYYLLARVLPWAGILVLSTTLAWAMTAGVTAGAHVPEGLSSPQTFPLVGQSPPAAVDDTLVGDDPFTAPSFRAASKVVTIAVEGPGGSYDLPCVTTTEHAPSDTVSVRSDQLMDLFRELCSPQPSS
jgi:hypothetical protein